MAADNATLQIPQDLIDPIIKAEINKRIVESLGASEKILTAAITSILNMPVTSDGKRPQYSSDKTLPWIEFALAEELKKVARDAIVEMLSKHGEQVKAGLVAELRKKNSPIVKQFADALIGGMQGESFMKWGITVQFNTQR